MASIYTDGTYFRKNPAWHEPDSGWKAGHVLTLLRRNGIEPHSVCEVGCGVGEILRTLAGALPATRFTGYEISPMAYAISDRKSGGNLAFKFGDFLEDSVEFDVVMAIDVFEHVEDYFDFLRRLRTRARYKIFHIPLEMSVQNVLRVSPLMHARRAVGHLHHFNRETALAALEDTGYEILDQFYTSGRTQLGGLGWRTQVLKWPRRITYSLSPHTAARVLGGYSLMVLAA